MEFILFLKIIFSKNPEKMGQTQNMVCPIQFISKCAGLSTPHFQHQPRGRIHLPQFFLAELALQYSCVGKEGI